MSDFFLTAETSLNRLVKWATDPNITPILWTRAGCTRDIIEVHLDIVCMREYPEYEEKWIAYNQELKESNAALIETQNLVNYRRRYKALQFKCEKPFEIMDKLGGFYKTDQCITMYYFAQLHSHRNYTLLTMSSGTDKDKQSSIDSINQIVKRFGTTERIH